MQELYVTKDREEKLRRVLENRNHSLTLVLENINDPHNMAAALRSCDSVGIMDVHFIYYGKQPFPLLKHKSSASAWKWLNKYRHDSVAECFDTLRKQGKKIYTTHMSKDAVSLYDLDLTADLALVFGNEHDGVSEEAYTNADGNFLIPQIGMIQSLNISVACAVSLFEAYRQRKKAGLYDAPSLSNSEIDSALIKWAKKR